MKQLSGSQFSHFPSVPVSSETGNHAAVVSESEVGFSDREGGTQSRTSLGSMSVHPQVVSVSVDQ